MISPVRPLHPIGNVRPQLYTLEPQLNIIPLFSRRPPWWARTPGTLGLLLCDVIITGACIELTWNHWTERVAVQSADLASSKGTLDKQQEYDWVLRPTWQRLGLCAGHFTAGCFFAGGLLGMRAQFVRSLTIIPPMASSIHAHTSRRNIGGLDLRKAVIETASHPENTGFEFSVKNSWLEEGRDKTELLLRCSDGNSRWFLGLQGASINGNEYAMEEARRIIIQQLKARQKPTKS